MISLAIGAALIGGAAMYERGRPGRSLPGVYQKKLDGLGDAKDDLRQASRLQKFARSTAGLTDGALRATKDIKRTLRDGRTHWWKTGESVLQLNCRRARWRHEFAVKRLSETRSEVRSKLPALIKRNQCRNDGSSMIDVGRNHRICKRLELASRSMDRAYRNLVENRKLFNAQVETTSKAGCQMSLPSVPLSGLARSINHR